jgi:hypothetical protein
VWRFLIKVKIHDPAILLLGIYQEECKSSCSKDITPMLIAALFTVAELWK